MLRLILLCICFLTSMFGNDKKAMDDIFPLYSQNVIDLGFELPKPFGISLIYSHIEQDYLINDLDASVNGSRVIDAEFTYVDYARAKSDTVQVRADLMLFPFLDLFVTAGQVEATVPLNIRLDGTTLFNQIGGDSSRCGGRLEPLECKLLGKDISFDATAQVDGYSYTLGTVFFTHFRNFIFALPIAYTWANMDKSETTRRTLVINPRIGGNIDFKEFGNLSLYVGAGYMDLDQYSNGTYTYPLENGKNIDIKYRAHQENKDKWNALVGGTLSIGKSYLFTLETGFLGSRQSVMTMFNYRF